MKTLIIPGVRSKEEHFLSLFQHPHLNCMYLHPPFSSEHGKIWVENYDEGLYHSLLYMYHAIRADKYDIIVAHSQGGILLDLLIRTFPIELESVKSIFFISTTLGYSNLNKYIINHFPHVQFHHVTNKKCFFYKFTLEMYIKCYLFNRNLRTPERHRLYITEARGHAPDQDGGLGKIVYESARDKNADETKVLDNVDRYVGLSWMSSADVDSLILESKL